MLEKKTFLGDNIRSLGLLAFTLFLLAFILHIPFWQTDFVLDGHYVVEHNPLIKNFGSAKLFFNKSIFSAYKAAADTQLNYYRPTILFSYTLDYQLWGVSPFGYRLTNILLHSLNCLLLFLISLKFFNQRMALLAAIFFCVFPTHEWVVRYVVGRGDLLEATFSLATLYLLLLCLQKNNFIFLVFSCLTFCFSLLSREIAILLPLYIVLLTYFYSRNLKKTLSLCLPYLLISISYYVLRLIYFPIVPADYVTDLSLNRLFEWYCTSGAYLLRLFVPWPVLAHLPDAWQSQQIMILIISLFLFFFLVALIKLFKSESRFPATLGIVWLFLSLLPFFITGKMTDKLGPYLSEHFLYFPSIGFALILASLGRTRRADIDQALSFLLIVYFLSINVYTHRFWKNEETLLRRVAELERCPTCVANQQVLMRFEENENKIHELVAKLDKPQDKSLWYKRLGNIRRLNGDRQTAITHFQKAITLNPRNLEALNEMAVTFLESGETAQGLKLLHQSLDLDAKYPDTQRLLGQAYYYQKNYPTALKYLIPAHELNPEDKESPLYIAMSYFFLGQQENYIRWIDKILASPSNRSPMIKFIARELLNNGYYQNLVLLLENSRSFIKDDIEGLRWLALAYERLNKHQKAEEVRQEIHILTSGN